MKWRSDEGNSEAGGQGWANYGTGAMKCLWFAKLKESMCRTYRSIELCSPWDPWVPAIQNGKKI